MGLMHLALGQAPVVLGDIDKNLEVMESLIVDAQSKCDDKLDLIAFPELFITGNKLRDNYNKVAERIPSSDKAQDNIKKLAEISDDTWKKITGEEEEDSAGFIRQKRHLNEIITKYLVKNFLGDYKQYNLPKKKFERWHENTKKLCLKT